MNDPHYPMTRVAANALMLALAVVAARLFAYVIGFVEGWRLESDLFVPLLIAGIAGMVGAIGTLLFSLGLVAQTLSGRAHPRYVSALAGIVVLLFASFLLPPPYRTGMAWSLWADGVDERQLVDFAAATRALPANAVPGPPRSGKALYLRDDALQPLQGAHRRIFDVFPSHAAIDITADRVVIRWGGLFVGVHGVAIVDRGPSPSVESADRSTRYHCLSPRVFTFDYFD